MKLAMNLVVIDNRDSFTFNLVDAFALAGAEPVVVRNSIAPAVALSRAQSMGAAILLSPGPGDPSQAGCCIDLIALAIGKVPLIGVCLGHQAIVAQAGGAVRRADEAVHGKYSSLDHSGEGAFANVPSPLTVGRYHSLCTPVADLPARFIVDAELNGMAMAVRDDAAKQLGVQFHPESILTPLGDRLVAAMLCWAGALRQAAN